VNRNASELDFHRSGNSNCERLRAGRPFLAGILFLAFALASSCGWMFDPVSEETVWTGALGDSIEHRYYLFGDFGVFYSFGGKDYSLAGIAATDCNEDLIISEVSPDETKLLMLLRGSNRYEHGTRLWIFDLAGIREGAFATGSAPVPLLDIVDPEVFYATIRDDRVDYRTASGWVSFPF
jgi:hypothetical protein